MTLVQNSMLQKEDTERQLETVCRNSLGNEKAENYSEIVQELISPYSATGCIMPSCHWNLIFFILMPILFPKNMAALYYANGERFHQDIS